MGDEIQIDQKVKRLKEHAAAIGADICRMCPRSIFRQILHGNISRRTTSRQ